MAGNTKGLNRIWQVIQRAKTGYGRQYKGLKQDMAGNTKGLNRIWQAIQRA